jgi:hypothetical protein
MAGERTRRERDLVERGAATRVAWRRAVRARRFMMDGCWFDTVECREECTREYRVKGIKSRTRGRLRSECVKNLGERKDADSATASTTNKQVRLSVPIVVPTQRKGNFA